MKFLIALLGDELDSLVAKRFEHAAWYMIVDEETNAGESTRHLTPRDRQEVLRTAASENVNAVVAGKFGDHSRKLIRGYKMKLLQVHGMTGRMAMVKAQKGELSLVSPDDGDEREKQRGLTIGKVQRPLLKPRKPKIPFTNSSSSSDSPRGHHHIQQYGGRGH